MLTRTTKAKDERGATAILTAVLALALFGTAALAVDLGNAFARKGDTQVQADFAALAGASKLPDQAAAVEAVAEYLLDNAARDDSGGAATTQAAMETALTNADPTDGHIEFLDNYRMRVVSPTARVDFGFGGVFASNGDGGVSGVDVASDATVLIGSPKGNGVLPMYVASPTPGNPACDYGLQTLTDPPDGQVVPPSVPTLYADADTNGNKLEGIATFESGAVPVTSLAKDTTTGSIRLDGDFDDAMAVGFFRSDSSTTAPVVVDRTSWTDPIGTDPYKKNNGAISVMVPGTVTAVEKLWYVRVRRDGTNKWSDKSEAQPLSVGDAPFECVGDSKEGNFGTLKMPRSSSNQANAEGWIARNIALGLEAPLSLALMPGSPPPWECNASTPGAVISTATDRRPSTNCLDTDTGMTEGTATPGFIEGGSDYEGLLDTNSSSEDPDGSGGCSRDGDTDAVNVKGHKLNDDLLTCFFTDTTTSIGDVARKNYNGGPKFDTAIYNSPRFAWVPVFKQETESGGSGYYSIVDFRPAFITDQPMTATKADNAFNTGTENGLGFHSNDKLRTLKVVFFHVDALPDGAAETPIGPYLGVGPRVIRLID